MLIERFSNPAAIVLAGVTCMFVLLLPACGGGSDNAVCGDLVCAASETASSCAEDCGCGNHVVNPGEQCDGPDLGDGTCMDQVQRGGTLRCNADCTFDVTGCTLASCGNGVAEEGESCDGADLGGHGCTDVGYAGGGLACSPDCSFDVTACCTDTCPSDGTAECVGNTLRTCAVGPTGCLAWQVTDCEATSEVCDSSGGTAACTCVDRCTTIGDTRCEGATIETCMDVGGCLDWRQSTDCHTDGKVCAEAPSGPVCVPQASAESCSEPYPLSPGDNIVAWTALAPDYLTAQPSCNSTALDGPDLVLSYTAPEDGFITFTLHKPASARQVVVASSAACGTLTPEVACLSDYSPTTLSTEFGVTMGTTYYFYVRDTTSGDAPLDNPLLVTLDQALCSSIDVSPTSVSPASGSSVQDLTPILTAELPYPMETTTGVITVTGDRGTNLVYDLSTGPSAIAITNGGKTLVIDPGIVFPANENVTVSWSGISDATCGKPITPPTWTFQVAGPPCTPGMDGMVGTTITRVPTGHASFSEYYVAADQAPDGYVYVGGTSDVYRLPKAGGTIQDVESAAGLTFSNEGYDMIVVGNEIYTLESNTTAFTNVLWRISTDGGATWTTENYASFPQTPNDDLRGITHYKGRLYMTTDESTAGTQIWSVAVGATTLPVIPVLEATVPEGNCSGVALDDDYFYLACAAGTPDRVVRVNRTTQAVELVTDQIVLNTTKNSMHAHDFDGDGKADALYVQGYYEEVHYVCKPNGAGPYYVNLLTSFGSGSTNYGLGFDPVDNALWMFDDDTREFVKIK